MVKLKTAWWKNCKVHRYSRWWNKQQRKAEQERQKEKHKQLQVQELRAVCKGLKGPECPGKLVYRVPNTVKVEAFFAREGGKRGAVVLSFASTADREAAMKWVKQYTDMRLEPAYSCKSNSKGWHRVRTWWKEMKDSEDDCEKVQVPMQVGEVEFVGGGKECNI